MVGGVSDDPTPTSEPDVRISPHPALRQNRFLSPALLSDGIQHGSDHEARPG